MTSPAAGARKIPPGEGRANRRKADPTGCELRKRGLIHRATERTSKVCSVAVIGLAPNPDPKIMNVLALIH